MLQGGSGGKQVFDEALRKAFGDWLKKNPFTFDAESLAQQIGKWGTEVAAQLRVMATASSTIFWDTNYEYFNPEYFNSENGFSSQWSYNLIRSQTDMFRRFLLSVCTSES